MSVKPVFLLVLILFLGSIIENQGISVCPERCVKISRRSLFRCRRLFHFCVLKKCRRTNKKGKERTGISCTQKEPLQSESPSPSPSFVSGPVPLPDENENNNSFSSPKKNKKAEFEDSLDVSEESLEPEISSEYEMETEQPSYFTPPDSKDTNKGGEREAHQKLALILNPFKSFAVKKNPIKYWKLKKRSMVSVRTTIDKSLRKQKGQVFYEDDIENTEKDNTDPKSFVSGESGKKHHTYSLEAFPKIIRVGEPKAVKLSLKIDKKENINGLESFLAFQLDSTTHHRTGACVELADDGTDIFFDDKGGDNVFTGIFAMKSDALNEQIDFEVVPVIDGMEKESHPLSFTAQSVVSTYGTHNPSADAIGGGALESPRISITDDLKDMQLKIHFIHFGDGKLLSSVQFLQDIVGVQCEELGNSNQLMILKDEGNVQTITIDLDTAMENGLFEKSVSMDLRAAYKESEDGAPILIISSLENKKTKSEVNGTRLSVPVSLGIEDECSENIVAKISIFVGEKTAVVLKGTSMQQMESSEYL